MGRQDKDNRAFNAGLQAFEMVGYQEYFLYVIVFTNQCI